MVAFTRGVARGLLRLAPSGLDRVGRPCCVAYLSLCICAICGYRPLPFVLPQVPLSVLGGLRGEVCGVLASAATPSAAPSGLRKRREKEVGVWASHSRGGAPGCYVLPFQGFIRLGGLVVVNPLRVSAPPRAAVVAVPHPLPRSLVAQATRSACGRRRRFPPLSPQSGLLPDPRMPRMPTSGGWHSWHSWRPWHS